RSSPARNRPRDESRPANLPDAHPCPKAPVGEAKSLTGWPGLRQLKPPQPIPDSLQGVWLDAWNEQSYSPADNQLAAACGWPGRFESQLAAQQQLKRGRHPICQRAMPISGMVFSFPRRRSAHMVTQLTTDQINRYKRHLI